MPKARFQAPRALWGLFWLLWVPICLFVLPREAKSGMRDFIVLTINKQRHEVSGNYAFMMLADYLRTKAGLCGTKIVCAEGDCGACTVLCYRFELRSE